jgi:hypothetical protein
MRELVGIIFLASVIASYGYSASRPFSKIGVSSAIQTARFCQQQRPSLPSQHRTGLLGSRCLDKDSEKVSKGLNVLELTGSLIPQGYLVKIVKAGECPEHAIDPVVLPQAPEHTLPTGWSTFWQIFMRELAPQDRYRTIEYHAALSVLSCLRCGTKQYPANVHRYGAGRSRRRRRRRRACVGDRRRVGRDGGA